MGCRLPDGEIAFLGRTDSQVKIRGYRIEFEEIAAVLNSHDRISVSTVALHGTPMRQTAGCLHRSRAAAFGEKAAGILADAVAGIHGSHGLYALNVCR